MSWSIGTQVKRGDSAEDLQREADQVRKQIDELKDDPARIGNSHCQQERDEQIDAAIRAAFLLLGSGVFANAGEVSVSFSGHANPGHEKDKSTANEFVAITISTQKYKSES
jgi:hypothetical protein